MNLIFEYGSVTQIPLYNCSNESILIGTKRPILGLLSMIYGLVMIGLFIPCLFIMVTRIELYKLSCYRIMFFVGLVDILALAMNSILTGYLAMMGAIFCTFPTLIFYSGLSGMSLWSCSCLANIVLLLNRISYLKHFHNSMESLLLLSVAYGFYFFIFTEPVLFSADRYGWFFNPFTSVSHFEDYSNHAHTFNNIFVVLITLILYLYIIWVIRNTFNSTFSAVHQKKNIVLKQAIVICSIDQIASIIYVVMNFTEISTWIVIIGHMLWQLAHGFPVITYLTINTTIRNEFFQMVFRRQLRSNGVTVINTSRSMFTVI